MTISATKKNGKASESIAEGFDSINQYNAELSPELAAICNVLRKEIDATLPTSTCKIWYANPVWFVGADTIVGYNITAKKTVNLLFWSGQLFDEPTLKAAGKFKAAQIQFKHESEIDLKALRGWLKKSETRIFDYNEMRKGKLEGK
jgi:Domain of unknown function (DU1801)